MSAMDYADYGRGAPRDRAALAMTAQAVLSGLVFGWRSDQRKAWLAALRERELALEIERLRAVGGC